MSDNNSHEKDESDSEDETDYRMIQLDDLQYVEHIWKDMAHNYYLTFDWRQEFYVNLAYNGFISVAQDLGNGRCLLIPEIQKAYCVLDFCDIHTSKSVRNKCKRGYRFRTNSDMEGVLEGISKYHESNWVIKPYRDMLLRLQANGGMKISGSSGAHLRAVSVELVDANGTLVAGEVGYTIGTTYTSLTGFFDKGGSLLTEDGVDGSKPPNRYSSAGKIQLIALGRYLESQGIDFWNLGHPPRVDKGLMIYKSEIGGKVLTRSEFLSRWKTSRDKANSGIEKVDCPPQDLILTSTKK